MSKMKLIIDELTLANILKSHMNSEEYFQVMDQLHKDYSRNAIPVDYILEYAKDHDAVCQVNLGNLIVAWEREE